MNQIENANCDMRQRHLFYWVGNRERKLLGFCTKAPGTGRLHWLIFHPLTQPTPILYFLLLSFLPPPYFRSLVIMPPLLNSPRHLTGDEQSCAHSNGLSLGFIPHWRPKRTWGYIIQFCNLIAIWPSASYDPPLDLDYLFIIIFNIKHSYHYLLADSLK
jgi:hypothetical protein